MATAYVFPNNTEWKPAGVGPAELQVQYGGDILVHFGGITAPADYDSGKHIHLSVDERYRYTGTENIYVRTANNNVANITQTGKMAYTPVTV